MKLAALLLFALQPDSTFLETLLRTRPAQFGEILEIGRAHV